jgi:hypothetical protein
MNLKNLKLEELNAQETKLIQGGCICDIVHYVKDWWNHNGWFRIV